MNSSGSSGPWTWFVVVAVGGLVTAGLSVFREGHRAASPAPESETLRTVSEAEIIERVTAQQSSHLPEDTFALGHQERALLLKDNGDPQRRYEIAGGLYAIAEKHLAMSNASEAIRVAQVCADLVPDSVTAARCWVLSGEASAFSQPELPLALRYLERADQVLLKQLAKHPQRPDALKVRSQLLLTLGTTEARFQRLDEAEGHLRQLIGEGPLAKQVTAETRLSALLALSQILAQPVPTEESEKLRKAAWALGTSEEVAAPAALHTLYESLPVPARESASLFAPPPLPDRILAPTRAEALQALWNCRRFLGLPEWFHIGDELASDHFFHEPRQSADFEIVVRQLLVSMPRALSVLPTDSPERAQLESIYASNLLLASQSAQERGDQSEVARLSQLFQATFDGHDVQFIAPLSRPRQRLVRIGDIYRETMLGHVEQLKQMQSSPRVPEPR